MGQNNVNTVYSCMKSSKKILKKSPSSISIGWVRDMVLEQDHHCDTGMKEDVHEHHNQ